MRTRASNRDRVFHFSNPNRQHAGKATGVSGESFNARVINVNGWEVCDFRFTRPNIAVNIYGPSLADDGDILSFSSGVSNVSGQVTYRWEANIGGGYYTAGISPFLSFTMPADIDLNIRLTVTDSEGRTDTDTHFVRNSFLNGGPCTICPDSTAFDFSLEDIQIDKIEKAQPLLYPNPSSDFVEIAFEDDISGFERMQIIDLRGSVKSEFLLRTMGLASNVLTLDVSNLQQATYIIKLIGDGLNKSFRFIKE